MKKFRRMLALLLLTAWALAGAAFAEEGGELQVHFLRIGRNDGILISMDGETAFLDGGSRYHGNVAADYMEKLGVTHLNFYVGTHAHSDHVGAACSLLARIPADEILYTYQLAVDCMLDSARTAEEKRVIRETPRRTLAYGDEFTVGAASRCAGADHQRRQRGQRGVHHRRRDDFLHLRKRGRQMEAGQGQGDDQKGADEKHRLRYAPDDQHAVLRVHRRKHRDR